MSVTCHWVTHKTKRSIDSGKLLEYDETKTQHENRKMIVDGNEGIITKEKKQIKSLQIPLMRCCTKTFFIVIVIVTNK